LKTHTKIIIFFLSLLTWPIALPALEVVTTTSLVADWVSQIGGEAVEVQVLVPADGDPHTFEPTPQDLAALTHADLVFAHGLHLEPWLTKLYKSSGSIHPPVTLGTSAATIVVGDEIDPHVWMDVQNVIRMLEPIKSALQKADPDNAALYEANARTYQNRLEDLDEWITQEIQVIPNAHRTIITEHDDLSYFAQRYRFTVLGNLLESASTDTYDPSAQHFAFLLEEIKAHKVRALFTEEFQNASLMHSLAKEAGLPPPYVLNVDALGAKGTATDTYEKLMRSNIKTLVKALK
tara:strand:- start:32646 stop:33521 length:876 start_codon:yes stop_codon:yes gene_type:complete